MHRAPAGHRQGIRARRRQLGITAIATAEAAGISRVTLHRIESGAASVTVGALINVLDAVDLGLGQLDRLEPGDGQLKGTAWLSPAAAANHAAQRI